MSGYTKLFSSLLASTVWREDDKTRIVWITLLAMANKNGVAEGSVPGLADFARVSVEDCQRALVKLSTPEEHSRSKAADGRRLKTVEGGWLLVNHQKYRNKMNADERREYLRLKQREYRTKRSKRLSTRCQQTYTDVNTGQQLSTTEAAGQQCIHMQKQKHNNNNNKRGKPIFQGQRFCVMPFMETQLQAILGTDTEAFNLHEWYFQLDSKLQADGAIDTDWPWLKAELRKEVRNRGLMMPTPVERQASERKIASQAPTYADWNCPHEPRCLNRMSCSTLLQIRS